jgi:uncharacterized protein with von Willebrand factor type A (vWA) domain
MAPPRQELEVEGEEIDLDAAFTFSPRMLQTRDFESMTAAELREVKAMIARLRLPLPELPVRRTVAAPRGHAVDLRDAARDDLGTRRDRAAGVAAKTPPPSAAGRPMRYFGFDGPVFAHAALLPSRDHQ